MVEVASMAFGTVIAARLLHNNLLDSILKAKMSFHESTPVGRILNRFSSDMSLVDTGMLWTLINVGSVVIRVLATIIAITYATPEFLIVFLPLTIYYVFVQVCQPISNRSPYIIGSVFVFALILDIIWYVMFSLSGPIVLQ